MIQNNENRLEESFENFPILVAEDNLASRKLLEKTLEKANHQVVTAENGRQALELFHENYYRIILTDWMMPEMDGLELCRAIRQSATKGYVFIILLTAKDTKDDIILGLKAGADDYLTKPINQAELIARLNTGKRILNLEKSLKKAIDNIKMLSITDPLTGCYNRGYIMENLTREIKRSLRYKRTLSLIFADIDHFKKINDQYGHQVGDRVLIEFVQTIYSGIRINLDWLVRYGGEEFILILPETDKEGAKCLAERLREKIEKMEIKVHEKLIKVTSSFGVVTLDPEEFKGQITPDELINSADKYLYKAKHDGRNRVVFGSLVTR